MLKGKNVIVTGATRGIGKEIALTLAQNGANIAINYRNYNDEIVELINALKEFGADVLAIKCDVSKSNEVENFVSEITSTKTENHEYANPLIAFESKPIAITTIRRNTDIWSDESNLLFKRSIIT